MLLLALILLLLPTGVLALAHVRETGLVPAWGWVRAALSLVGLVSLVVFAMLTVRTFTDGWLAEGAYPARVLLLFLVSGVAFAVAILPGQAAQRSDLPQTVRDARFEGLLRLPAWVWIAVAFYLLRGETIS